MSTTLLRHKKLLDPSVHVPLEDEWFDLTTQDERGIYYEGLAGEALQLGKKRFSYIKGITPVERNSYFDMVHVDYFIALEGLGIAPLQVKGSRVDRMNCLTGEGGRTKYNNIPIVVVNVRVSIDDVLGDILNEIAQWVEFKGLYALNKYQRAYKKRVDAEGLRIAHNRNWADKIIQNHTVSPYFIGSHPKW